MPRVLPPRGHLGRHGRDKDQALHLFDLGTIAVALGAVLLLGMALQPAMAKVRPVPQPPTPSCSFTSNVDDSLTLTATGLLARYPKAEARTDVTVTQDGSTITSPQGTQSDSYVATYTGRGQLPRHVQEDLGRLEGHVLRLALEPVVADTTPPVDHRTRPHLPMQPGGSRGALHWCGR